MPLSGSSYYHHRGFSGSGSGSEPVTQSVTHSGLRAPPGFRFLTNPGSTFPVENTSPGFPHGLNTGFPSDAPAGESGKRKRGRPRKYGPDRTNMSLGLSPMSSTPPSGSITPTPKRGRGRPPGSGRKQQLAHLGGWMLNSAGLAFAPHIINIEEGEDIASKVLSFAQQRPRAICVLSANGVVSAVTLRQPASSGSTVTYEGRFQILCLSGSYLVSESGEAHSRTGGLSVSLCSPDGHVIGGGIGGILIAASPVQVILCSFAYGVAKLKNKTEVSPNGEPNYALQPGEKSVTPATATFSQYMTPNSSAGARPGPRPDLRNPQLEFDLTRG
ncbi:hypothetical protein U1Q18_021245 [Sarracenia purpurea var. burkii]